MNFTKQMSKKKKNNNKCVFVLAYFEFKATYNYQKYPKTTFQNKNYISN